MRHHTHGRVHPQIRRTRRQLLEANPEVCWGRLLPQKAVTEALARHGVVFRKRLYTPMVTLWMFLCQVLSPDQSCRAAVSRLLAWISLAAGGACSFRTGAYCKARGKLPEPLLRDLARTSAQKLQAKVPALALLGGRPIKIADGTTVSMPDTKANQKAYPQSRQQEPGLGFPIMRIVGLLCLASGAWLDLAMGSYRGQRTGETALLRQLLSGLRGGDVLLADAYFANYWMVALLGAQRVDLVSHHDGKRRIDFRAGQRLGRGDHIVVWDLPPRPYWMSRRQYRRLPKTLRIREVKVTVTQRGFRSRQFVVVTTLLDPQAYPAAELAAVYRVRWNAELDIRTIKHTMQMDVLRCQSPDMVRKEVWMHVLAYNLIRTLMAQAAAQAGIPPREISFTGTLQALVSFAGAAWACPSRRRAACYRSILQAVAVHRVGDRPDRIEPRAVKRRPKEQDLLTVPRAQARALLIAGR